MAHCVFCALPFQKPGRPRSEEHAYPQWIERYVPASPGENRIYLGHHTGTHGGPTGSKATERDMPIGTFDQICREVCVPCNTGWMERELEAKVRPHLIPILRGERSRLAYGALRITAAWAWKTAAMIQLLGEREARGVSSSEYAWFFSRRTPPTRSRVWLGRYDGTQYREGWGTWVSTVTPVETPISQHVDANVYSVYFTVGEVFLLVFGTSSPRMTPLAPRGALRRIWPTAPGDSYAWPGDASVSDGVIEQLREASEARRMA
jgi:hypothetical protein